MNRSIKRTTRQSFPDEQNFARDRAPPLLSKKNEPGKLEHTLSRSLTQICGRCHYLENNCSVTESCYTRQKEKLTCRVSLCIIEHLADKLQDEIQVAIDMGTLNNTWQWSQVRGASMGML